MRTKTGSIDVTRDGRFRLRITLPSGERPTYGTYDTREEAERERAAALAVVTTETSEDAWTLKTWGERTLNARDVGKIVADPESDWSRWNQHVVDDPIARVGLKSLRRRHLKPWIHRLRAKGLKRSTIFNCINVVSAVLRSAVEDEIIKVNPAQGLRRLVPKEKLTEEPWTFATLEEQRRLVLVADDPERWIIAFAIGTGLRAGELVALRLADVQVDVPDPHVTVRYGGAPMEPTKGGKIRRVDLFGLGLLAAREWLAALPAWLEGKRSGKKRANRNPNGLMFPRLRGGYRDHLHVLPWARWQEILVAAGITRDFRWHDLRHTCGSSLVSGVWGRAWTLIEVRDYLGHESVTTTERYAHLGETAQKKAAAETRAARGGGSSDGGTGGSGGSASGHNRPGPVAADAEKASGSGSVPSKTRTCDPRFRKSPDQAEDRSGIEGRGQLEAVSLAFLRAVASGDAATADRLQVELGSLLAADRTRAIELAERIVAEALARATTRSA